MVSKVSHMDQLQVLNYAVLTYVVCVCVCVCVCV